MAVLLAAGDAPLAPTDPDSPLEAVRWFRARAPISRDRLDEMDEHAHRRGFTLANAVSLDVVTQVWRAADRAIATGTRFSDFRREAASALAQTWAGDSAGRAEVVFRNAVQTAYSAGRHREMSEPDILAERPFWRFDAILDSRTTRICQPLDGLIRPASDAWWSTHYPPLHHQCRSGVSTLTAEQAGRAGGPGTVPESTPQRGWGSTPDASEWEPRASDYPPELWAAIQHQQSTAPKPRPVPKPRPKRAAKPPAPKPVADGSREPIAPRLRALGIDLDRLHAALSDNPGAPRTDAQQRAIREELNRLGAQLGLVPNPARPNRFAYSTGRLPANALHHWDGRIEVDAADVHPHLVGAVAAIRAGASFHALSEEQQIALKVLAHETTHGYGRAAPGSYAGVGAKVEEIATETVARRIVRDVFGLSVDTAPNWLKPLITEPRGFPSGSYGTIIRETALAGQAASGVTMEQASAALDRAALRFHAEPVRVNDNADSYAGAFVTHFARELTPDATPERRRAVEQAIWQALRSGG